eukprot:3453373-Pleurochrysis_carterae.AAC.1
MEQTPVSRSEVYGGQRKKRGFWRRKETRQDYIMNKLTKDDRRARRAKVIEICEEWKERAEEQLKWIRKEMRKTTNTDALIQSLVSLRKGGRKCCHKGL